MTQKKTIPDIRARKQTGQRITMLTAYDAPWAQMVDRGGIDIILVGDSLGMVVLGYEDTVSVTMAEMLHHIRAVTRVVKSALVVGDMPFGSYNVSPEQAVENANRIMKEGRADAVKLEGGNTMAPVVEAIVRAGIPVQGHIGLTPQTASALGGFKVQGKSAEAAGVLVNDARALEKAGCFSLILEAIPAPIARMVTDAVSIPTIGIGAGADCDGQVLVTYDMVGLFDRFTPKFVKQYTKISDTVSEAIAAFKADVEEQRFPAEEHSFTIKAEELEKIVLEKIVPRTDRDT